MRNPLLQLRKLGQRIWLDDIRRAWLDDGTLERLIDEDGLAGVTSNPAIFARAVGQSRDYDAAVATLARAGTEPAAIADALTIRDVARAADLFRLTHHTSGGADGFVSLEVAPRLAQDTDATVAEGQRLWAALARPNAMIKVPATRAGLGAIARLIAEGVNVNVTLIFGVARYCEVVEAFMAGLEQRAAAGAPLDHVTSVASFFVSRIDTRVDQRLDEIGGAEATALRGQTAIAIARLAYQQYRHGWLPGARWQALARRGARPQRLLWASTSAKDKAYSALKYVEALIGPDTINTLPLETLDAYRAHGEPRGRIEDELDAARALPQRLAALGIDLSRVADELEADGVAKFAAAWDVLLRAIAQRCEDTSGSSA